ncbi:MAG TPA: Sec-independent protein translocase protein TatB [Xanthobacteraceae bacterium]|nr:Sec-independent protein translocase protein TatB [Xanthobacteraceae bacterium]
MFDIGWSELVVIAVVALIAIGPKELPGVLRMVGQWMGKMRRMASEFQGQFNEAMREAEMADLKKSFDDIRDTAKGFTTGNLLGDVQKDVEDALKIDTPTFGAESSAAAENAATSALEATPGEPLSLEPTLPAPPTAETFIEAEQHSAAEAVQQAEAAAHKPAEPQAAAAVPADQAAPAAGTAKAS